VSDLVVIVPSRGRPNAVAEMAEAFEQTCTTNVRLWFAVDEDDPAADKYAAAMAKRAVVAVTDNESMVDALNKAARYFATGGPPHFAAIGFMGDDHRPRTKGWDRAYLDALTSLPGIVYGNDLIQGVKLPTQCAMSASAVRALGHMAPPPLTHLYVDNYWLEIGQAAGCITYLPDVVVEHVHPVGGTAEWDAGYRRVNSRAMYGRDQAAYAAYMAEHRDRDVLALMGAGR
jgi:hypothetical protein